MYDFVWDIECYQNLFLVGMKNTRTGQRKRFECSDWNNDYTDLRRTIKVMKDNGARMVGFRNTFYDYPLLHHVLKTVGTRDIPGTKIARIAKIKSDQIINSRGNQWEHVIWDNECLVPQIDLFRIHHFDNIARMTSLKTLEFNMRSNSIQDLPYPPDAVLDERMAEEVVRYNDHDIDQTEKFLIKSADSIRFREELTARYGKNFLNHNDTKIGKDFFIMELEKAGVKCFGYDPEDGRYPIQTHRRQMYLEDIILPVVKFERPEFNAIKNWVGRQVIRETKGVFTEFPEADLGDLARYSDTATINKKINGEKVPLVRSLNCVVDGFKFVFGTGGVHGSVNPTIIHEDDDWMILDLDVTSYYPNIAIVNHIYPQHLGETFVQIYKRLYEDRKKYEKGTPENAMLKLALNGVYGDSNNQFSPFYDPQYTMSITINGQLLLCMLAERLLTVPGLQLLQVNTDGLTVRMRRSDKPLVDELADEWQEITGLNLEGATYRRMFIRDVNNYIGEYTDGKLKRKGAYEYDREWHQNHSALVVPKIASKHLIEGIDIHDAIRQHDDPMDFMLRTNVNRTSTLDIEYGGLSEELQRTTRYYISNEGGTLIKTMPPLPKNPDKWRRFNLEKGWFVTPMNEMDEVTDINYDYYEQKVRELVDPLLNGMMEDLI